MNTLQHADLKVNSGTPKPTETPLWKGKTTFRVGGKPLVAAVSVDRTWFRVRFEGMDEPLAPEMHAQMVSATFAWAKKDKNLCYFGESNSLKVAMLRTLGFSNAKHIEEPVIAEVAKVKGNVPHPAQVEAKGKTTTTVKVNEAAPTYTPTVKAKAGVVVGINAVGRPYNGANGQFISKDKLVNTVNGHAVHEDGESLGYDMTDEEATAYHQGFVMGRQARDTGVSLAGEWQRGYEDGFEPDPIVDTHVEELSAIRESVATLAAGLASITELLAKLGK